LLSGVSRIGNKRFKINGLFPLVRVAVPPGPRPRRALARNIARIRRRRGPTIPMQKRLLLAGALGAAPAIAANMPISAGTLGCPGSNVSDYPNKR
jgi:hypothetical protein